MKQHITRADFERGIQATIDQGHRCVNADGSCIYFGPNGDRCGIGHMLKEDPPRNGPIRHLIEDGEVTSDVPTRTLQLVQNIHDNKGQTLPPGADPEVVRLYNARQTWAD